MSLMKYLFFIIISIFSIGCDLGGEAVILEERVTESPAQLGSFTIRNNEMRELIMAEAEKKSVEIWINENGSIGYYLADGDEIDDIVTYAFAVFWVNN